MTSEQQSVFERRIRRRDFLKLGAFAGGALFMAACGGSASSPTSTQGAKRASIGQEPGDLTVIEWEGYDAKPLWKSYASAFPDAAPKYVLQTNNNETLAKIRAGFTADVAHSDIDYIRDWLKLDALQPWDPELLTNFEALNPALLEAGRVDGEQYMIPVAWGFNAPLYRADKVEPREMSWNLIYDERYAGKIGWADDIKNLVLNGMLRGVPNPWAMSDEELAVSRDDLIARKDVVRTFWTNQSGVDQDMAGGNLWINGLGWGPSYVALKEKGLDVTYMQPQEGRNAWSDGFVLLKDAKNYHHAHAYVDSWASPESAQWLLSNYAYGHSNTLVDLDKIDPVLVEIFRLDDKTALDPPNAFISQWTPNRDAYVKAWQQVKSA